MWLGLGGADDGAHRSASAESAPASRSAKPVDQRRQALVERRARRRRQVLEIGGARVAGADQGEDAGAAASAAATSGSRASAPSSGLAVKASAPSPATGPQGVGVSPTSAWRVGGGGDRHVAALAVGDDQQAGLAGARRRPRRAPPSPGAPSRSKQASCGLTATQAGAGALDQRAAVGGDGAGGDLGRRALDRRARSVAGAAAPDRGRGRGRPGCGARRRASAPVRSREREACGRCLSRP